MRRCRILTVGIIAGLAASGAIAWLVLTRHPSWLEAELMDFVDNSIRQAEQMRVKLLCESDHPGLLQAGREVLARVPPDVFKESSLKPGRGRTMGFIPIPQKVPIPEAIRKLGPRAVLIDTRGYLMLEMHGGMDHFGLYVYPEGYKAQDSDYYGDRLLIPGLWYYDDGYLHNPDYDKRIDTLVETHKTGNAEGR